MSHSNQQLDAPSQSLHAVNFTLSEIWQNTLEIYFIRIESALYSDNVTKELTKYHKLVEALSASVISQVQSLLSNPPADAPFSTLKVEILQLSAMSDRERYHQLIKEESLDDRKLSELLRQMLSLLEDMRIDEIAKAKFENMLQLGIIRPSESPWASPLHMVPKATSGDWRPCGDYRALNNATIPDRYPVSHLQDFAGALFSGGVFSKIDLPLLHKAATIVEGCSVVVGGAVDVGFVQAVLLDDQVADGGVVVIGPVLVLAAYATEDSQGLLLDCVSQLTLSILHRGVLVSGGGGGSSDWKVG
ncbi:hypothetical protein SprV_0100290700 [Sparganum proliferum]